MPAWNLKILAERILQYFAGPDAFVSYAHKGATRYPAQLGIGLRRHRLRCYIDQYTGETDEEVPPSVLRQLARSSMLIVLATEKAADSKAVRDEIRLFREKRRPICPISFDGSSYKHGFEKLLPGLSPVEESRDAWESGKPSEHVLQHIDSIATFRRLAERQVRANVAAAGSLLAALAGLAFVTYQIRQTSSQLDDARTAYVRVDGQLGAARQNLKSASDTLEKTEVRLRNADLVAEAQERIDPVEQNRILAAADPTNEPPNAIQFVLAAAQRKLPRRVPNPRGHDTVRFTMDGRYFVSSESRRGCCTLWDAARAQPLKDFTAEDVTVLPDSERLVAVREDHASLISLHDPSRATRVPLPPHRMVYIVSSKTPGAPVLFDILPPLRGSAAKEAQFKNWVLVVSASGQTLAERKSADDPWTATDRSLLGDGTAAMAYLLRNPSQAGIWTSRGGQLLVLQHEAPVQSVRLHPDQPLAVTQAGQIIYFWNFAGPEPKLLNKFESGAYHLASFSPDGRHLLLNNGSALAAMAVEKPQTPAVLDGSDNVVTFDHYPAGFAAVGRDDTVRVWTLGLGYPTNPYRVPHLSTVQQVDLNSAGLLTLAADQVLRVWRFEGGASPNYREAPDFLKESFYAGKGKFALQPGGNLVVLPFAEQREFRIWDIKPGTGEPRLLEIEGEAKPRATLQTGRPLAGGWRSPKPHPGSRRRGPAHPPSRTRRPDRRSVLLRWRVSAGQAMGRE